jgi:Flp pilus assembly protein TadG
VTTRRFHRWAPRRDDGNAIIEFVFVAVLITVPLVYLVVALAAVQRAQLAVTTAAREAGRAFASAPSTDVGRRRADIAARIAFADAGLADAPQVSFVAAGASCRAAEVTPELRPGAEFTICVRRQTALPGVPSLLQGRGVTNEARYLLHVDDFRSA